MFRLSDFVEIYTSRRPGISVGWTSQLQVAVSILDRWRGQPTLLSDLSEDLILEFMADFGKHRAARTVNTKRSAVLTLWRAAHEMGYVAKAPGKVPRLKEPRRMPTAWTAEQIAQLVRYAATLDCKLDGMDCGPYWSSLFLTAYWTGVRTHALRMVRTADCDLDAGWLMIRAENQKNGREQLFRLPKQAVDAIRKQYHPAQEFLWPWPYHPRTFYSHVRRIMEGAGLRPEKSMGQIQQIRRTAVSYAARESLELARRLAGHSSIELTRRHYIDERVATVPSAADVLPKLDI